jgi:hypothetical protein
MGCGVCSSNVHIFPGLVSWTYTIIFLNQTTVNFIFVHLESPTWNSINEICSQMTVWHSLQAYEDVEAPMNHSETPPPPYYASITPEKEKEIKWSNAELFVFERCFINKFTYISPTHEVMKQSLAKSR